MLAGALVVGAVVGVPLALATRAAAASRHPVHGAAVELSELTTALILAGLAAPLVHGSVYLQIGGAVAWLGLGALATDRSPVAPILALLVFVGAGLAALVLPLGAAPWTLLQPVWGAWPEGLPVALVAGLLLAGAGTGHWLTAGPPPPRSHGAPWIALGGGAALVAVLALRQGSAFEAGVEDPVLGVLGAGLLVAGASSHVTRTGPGRWRRAAAGAALLLWLSGPAWGGLDLVLSAVIPLGLAVQLLLLAWVQPQARRLRLVGAGVALLALVLGWPGFASTLTATAAVVALPVVALWLVGTRATLGRA